MKVQFELHVGIEPAAASSQRFNWSGPPSGTRNFLKEHMVHVPGVLWEISCSGRGTLPLTVARKLQQAQCWRAAQCSFIFEFPVTIQWGFYHCEAALESPLFDHKVNRPACVQAKTLPNWKVNLKGFVVVFACIPTALISLVQRGSIYWKCLYKLRLLVNRAVPAQNSIDVVSSIRTRKFGFAIEIWKETWIDFFLFQQSGPEQRA